MNSIMNKISKVVATLCVVTSLSVSAYAYNTHTVESDLEYENSAINASASEFERLVEYDMSLYNTGCSGHIFVPKRLSEASHNTSVHYVGVNATPCTITTIGTVYVDICSKCGYHGPTYITYADHHSVSH